MSQKPATFATNKGLQKADEFLQSTIVHLELTGWCQGKAIAKDGSCCLSHVLYNTMTISNNFTPFQRELAIAALYACLPPNTGIITFNDTAGRTFEEIIKLLQDARQWLAAQFPAPGTN